MAPGSWLLALASRLVASGSFMLALNGPGQMAMAGS